MHNTNKYRYNTNCLYSIHTNMFTLYWFVLVRIRLYLFVLNTISGMYLYVFLMYLDSNTDSIQESETEYKHNTDS